VAYFDFLQWPVLNLSALLHLAVAKLGRASSAVHPVHHAAPTRHYIVAKQNVRASDHKNNAYGNRNGGFH
jgi:hypothetical protein